MDFSQISTAVRTDDKGKHDLVRPVEGLTMVDAGTDIAMRVPPATAGGQDTVYRFADWAYGQMCGKLKIPSRYMRECPPALQVPHFQHWMNEQAEGKKLLLRCKHQKIRGILSDKYQRFDNKEMTAIMSGFNPPSGTNVQRFFLTDRSLLVRMVFPGTFKIGNDSLQAGLVYGNSEVGARCISLEWLLFKMVCTNGMVVTFDQEKLFEHIHIGIRREEIIEALSTSVEKLPEFVEAVKAKGDAATKANAKQADYTKIEDKIGKGFMEEVRAKADEKAALPTVWDVVNIMTELSQKQKNSERQHNIDHLAGQMLIAA